MKRYLNRRVKKLNQPSTKLIVSNTLEKILSEKNRHKTSSHPSWVKKLNEPTINFNLETSSYAQITKIVMKMKSSASPCLNDAISIIAFKKCAILRSHLVKIILTAWKEETFPKIWCSGVTVLAHRKDEPGKPENFRPIIFQPVLPKVFTSLICSRLYTFEADNGYIETNTFIV